jgi:hypothetical protein
MGFWVLFEFVTLSLKPALWVDRGVKKGNESQEIEKMASTVLG